MIAGWDGMKYDEKGMKYDEKAMKKQKDERWMKKS